MVDKIKVLYIIDNIKISSGVSSVIMNYIRKINREKFQIDFLLMTKYEESYEEELQRLGSKIIYLNNKFLIKNIKNMQKEVEKFFENNKYDIVELHAPTFSFLFLKVAKKCNIPVRIVHSHSTIHSTNKIKNLLSIILNVNLKNYANKFFACSEKSGQYWFGKKICNSNSYKLITNGIDIQKYKFDKKIRNVLRKKYDIDNKIVIGFVGRISKDKNLPFFIEVMKEVIKKDKRYLFLVIGDGRELYDIKLKSEEIKENIIFLGRKNDVDKQLNCMDLLVLPSKREGLPMVAVEAQLTNLPCFLSDTITKEVDIGNIKFIKLNKKEWVKEILKFKIEDRNEVNKEKFNVDICAKELEEIYHEYYEERLKNKNEKN